MRTRKQFGLSILTAVGKKEPRLSKKKKKPYQGRKTFIIVTQMILNNSRTASCLCSFWKTMWYKQWVSGKYGFKLQDTTNKCRDGKEEGAHAVDDVTWTACFRNDRWVEGFEAQHMHTNRKPFDYFCSRLSVFMTIIQRMLAFAVAHQEQTVRLGSYLFY